MKTSDFYSNADSFDNSTATRAGYLDNISVSELIQKRLCEPYYMGYIPWEDFPKCCGFAYVDRDNSHVTLNPIAQNVGWGYCLQRGSGSYNYGSKQQYGIRQNGTLYTLKSNDEYRIAFINHIKMATVNTYFSNNQDSGTTNTMTFTINSVEFTSAADTDTYLKDEYGSAWGTSAWYQPIQSTSAIGKNYQLTYEQFSNFINGGTWELTTQRATYHAHLNDFNEHGVCVVKSDDNNYVLHFAIANVLTNFKASHAYWNGNQYLTYPRTILPFFGFKLFEHVTTFDGDMPLLIVPGNDDNKQYLYAIKWLPAYEIIDPNYFYMANDNMNGNLYTGSHYTITAQDLKANNVGYRAVGIYKDCCFIKNGGGDSGNVILWVQPVIHPLDYYKYTLLYHKQIITNAAYSNEQLVSYYQNITNVTIFNENNCYTGDRETGNYTDAQFAVKLRDWQLPDNDITVDTFDAANIPEYVPPSPVDDGENIGDKITRPATLGIGGTNGFVTLYALRKVDIQQLGELLWTSFVDQDYWKNYLFSLALDTGTFSLAGLLNFFVSCRVYPFSLVNIAGCSTFGQNMFVGTGIVPLAFTTQLHVLSDMVDYISGGYCNIPRHFNDWRDYVNTEIMLYIPYCGTVRLNPGDVIGNKISVQYAVDFATGGCIAYVDMETGDGAGYPVGALPGQIGADIPLTATAAGEVAARFIGDALNIGGIVAGEGANVASGALGAAMGKPSAGGSGNVLSGAAGMLGGLPAAMAVDMAVPLAKQGLSMLARGAVQAPMLSGGRGFASFGAPQKPYVQIRRGIYPEISGLLDIAGKPAATTTTIGALSGFVQGDVKTDGLPCHENEKAKIRRLIADGIYV